MIYLLHFSQPYRHARHYLGYAKGDGKRRLAHHANGTGARLLQVVRQAGITWTLVRTWPDGDRREERRLKRRGSSARHCPICRQARVVLVALQAVAAGTDRG